MLTDLADQLRSLTEGQQTVRNVLESKIHQSFTVACDRMFAMGLLTREQRIALSGLIGQTLKQFGESIPTKTGNIKISAEEVMKLVESAPDEA